MVHTSVVITIVLLSILFSINFSFGIVKSHINFKIRSTKTSLAATSQANSEEYAELLRKLESRTKATTKATKPEVKQEVKQEVKKEAAIEIKSLEKQYQEKVATQPKPTVIEQKKTSTISTPTPPVSVVKSENGGGLSSYLPIALAVAVIPAGIFAFLKSKESEV